MKRARALDCRVPRRAPACAPPARALAALGRRRAGRRAARGRELARAAGRSRRACRALNRRYRGKDKPTNVLSFPGRGDRRRCRPRPLGDLVICPAVVRREARAQGKTLRAHWAHLMVHGALHLVGYDHERDARAARMERREIAVLQATGFGNPYRDGTARSSCDERREHRRHRQAGCGASAAWRRAAGPRASCVEHAARRRAARPARRRCAVDARRRARRSPTCRCATSWCRATR